MEILGIWIVLVIGACFVVWIDYKRKLPENKCYHELSFNAQFFQKIKNRNFFICHKCGYFKVIKE